MTDPTEPTPATLARAHLTTITRGWPHAQNPMHIDRGGTTQQGPRAATEDDLQLPLDARLDVPIILAFWVRAAVDEWPTILQTLQPDDKGRLRLVTTETIDCADVPAMAQLLHREADRLTTWVDETTGKDFGQTFLDELENAARAVAKAAWPPKGDRLVIGDCPTCGRRVRVKAPPWRRVPHPTTDPDTYPAWSDWQPHRDRPITCRCGREDSLDGWREALAGPSLPLTAEQLVAEIRRQFGLDYRPLSVRTWARRGMITPVDHRGENGRARYDRVQVFAALMARERRLLDDEERSA